ncbi:MAG: hypothetical protein TEF_06525 [Rhizobiales bacterium NRL2]|jgi:hypothetical protein|nr:MAG: hypothetical protein TEF_06525 [Rhizobiales bacterium NRL2]
MRPALAHALHPVFGALLVAAIMAASILLVGEAGRLSHWETQRAELDDIRYGALDADEWVARLTTVAAREIDEFEVTPENRPHIKALLTRLVDRLIVEVPRIMTSLEDGGDNLVERLFGSTANRTVELLVEASGLRGKAPEIADALIDELQQPETKKELVYMLHGALESVARDTFAEVDRSPLRRIEAAYGCASPAACRDALGVRIENADRRATLLLAAMVAASLMLVLLAFVRFRSQPRFTAALLCIAAAALLYAGVGAPMIQIDARLAEMRFHLMGAAVNFENQVIYFQSKSILEVVEVLARTGQPDMLLVGGLIALFSIGFPLAKIIATALLAFRPGSRAPSPLLRFFAWHASKWAMADVFVVAMFMAYIGMRGLVGDQLGKLAAAERPLEVLTTNGTSLEPGFWAFLIFALYGILMAALVQRWREGPAADR